MFELNHFTEGYTPVVLALNFVLAYFVLASLIVRLPGPRQVVIPRYEPPQGASPAVAAWLLEPGKLPRSMAAAVVNMAAKGYLKIEQSADLYSLTKLETEPTSPLEPEEDALARILFSEYDSFDFVQATSQLTEAIRQFRWALRNTTYFSERAGVSSAAWIVSVLATLYAVAKGKSSALFSPYFWIDIFVTLGCFIVAVRTLRGPLDKIVTRFPGSTAPRRPWTGSDRAPFTFLLATLGGLMLLALLSTNADALITTCFLAVNAFFFHALQGLTPAGKEMVAQLTGYRKFLSEVDADVFSRVNSPDDVPRYLHRKDAYAIAFHIDLGWGEQFVSSIADLIERADVLSVIRPHQW